MTDTTYVDGVTKICGHWLNDVNRVVYTILNNPSDLAALVATLAIPDSDDLDGNPDNDHTSDGPKTAEFSAGENVALMELCYMKSDGKWWRADASTAATGVGLLCVALQAKSADEAMSVAMAGSFIRDDTWSWTPGAPLYISETAGAITASPPSAGIRRVIGHAAASNRIFLNPDATYGVL